MQRAVVRTARSAGGQGREGALRALADALPVPAAVLGADRSTLAWNTVAEGVFGWSAAEVVGTRLPLITDQHVAELRLLVNGALQGQSPVRLETEGLSRAGRRIGVRLSASALGGMGIRDAVLVTMEDISDRTGLRRQLRHARRHSRRLADVAPEPLLVLRDDVVSYANPACHRLLAAEDGRLRGVSFSGLVISGAEELARLSARCEARRAGAIVEARLRRLDGEPLDVEAVARPLRLRRGSGLLLSLRDMGAHSLAENELRRSHELLRLMAESLRGHATIALDPDGRLISWNADAERLFGYAAAEAVGCERALLFRPEDTEAGQPAAQLRATLELGRFEGECWQRRADASVFRAAITLAPQYAAGARLIGFSASLRDLTQQQEAQEALRRTEEQLRHAQRMESVGRLATGVAHDFNNLLTAIRGYAQLLLDELGEDPRAADVQEIRRAADRGAALSRQMLALGRRQAVHPVVLDLNAVIAESGPLLTRMAGDDVLLETRLEPSLAAIRADGVQLEQVLMNLVANARDAMPEGGRVVLATRNELSANPPRVVLTVSDTGSGMDAETRSRIFEPFFTTKAPGAGTGLGLATVYAIVQQCGGTVSVASEPGEGAMFEIALPAVAAAAPNAKRLLKAPPPNPPLILVAVGDLMLRALARRTLERRGYEVLEAESAAAAMRQARAATRAPNLLIADSTMEGTGGRAVVEALAGACKAPRVLYLSDAPDAAASRPLSGPEAAVLTKPFTPLVLARRVRALLDRGVAT